MNIFYQKDLGGDDILLSEEESKHAIRVLRLSIGSQVEIVDGKGTRAVAEVSDDHPKRCALRILSRKNEKPSRNFHLHIAVAPTKNIERIEWFAEKATEIGIDEITLLDCEHSERTTVKTERLEKVAISAIKQSQQSWMPTIHEMKKFDAFIREANADMKMIAHCEEGTKNPISSVVTSAEPVSSTSTSLSTRASEKLSLTRNANRILILIGPEGDFSPAEIESAIANHFIAVSLGETRLRTETAALYSLMAVHLTNQ